MKLRFCQDFVKCCQDFVSDGRAEGKQAEHRNNLIVDRFTIQTSSLIIWLRLEPHENIDADIIICLPHSLAINISSMASITSNSSHSRSRSLRSNTLSLKPPVGLTAQPIHGPSSIALFLTNLRLLDLDLRDDWPDITLSTFSTKDQKKRIQSVEWALYQLFVLWDPEEARDVIIISCIRGISS